MLNISPTARVSHLADIEDSVRGSTITIGKDVTIDFFVKIKPAGGIGDVAIGDGTTINSGVVIYTGNGVAIGRQCAIAANCTFVPVNHEIADRGRPIVEQGFMPSRVGILVEDDVWIGANVVLLDGAVVRRGSVVGAGAVVTGGLPPTPSAPARRRGLSAGAAETSPRWLIVPKATQGDCPSRNSGPCTRTGPRGRKNGNGYHGEVHGTWRERVYRVPPRENA